MLEGEYVIKEMPEFMKRNTKIDLRDVGTNKDLDNIYTYHAPESESQLELYKAIRNTAKAFATLIIEHCPETRERSLALTKLEEVVMWANASVARHGGEE